jgi:hypothetical protein
MQGQRERSGCGSLGRDSRTTGPGALTAAGIAAGLRAVIGEVFAASTLSSPGCDQSERSVPADLYIAAPEATVLNCRGKGTALKLYAPGTSAKVRGSALCRRSQAVSAETRSSATDGLWLRSF